MATNALSKPPVSARASIATVALRVVLTFCVIGAFAALMVALGLASFPTAHPELTATPVMHLVRYIACGIIVSLMLRWLGARAERRDSGRVRA